MILWTPMLEILNWSRVSDIACHASVAGLKRAQSICPQSDTTARGFVNQGADSLTPEKGEAAG
jgi:hypothetical protein